MNSVRIGGTTISLLQGDITLVSADAIVNAANTSLAGGGGVDGAIHRAGGPSILAECRAIVAAQVELPPGQAIITGAGWLKAKHVIHTVGPVWHGGTSLEAEILASAYTESLKLATARGLKSIAFPSISTGAYHYPVQQAASVALGAVAKYFRENRTTLEEVRFVLYDAATLEAYQENLPGEPS